MLKYITLNIKLTTSICRFKRNPILNKIGNKVGSSNESSSQDMTHYVHPLLVGWFLTGLVMPPHDDP